MRITPFIMRKPNSSLKQFNHALNRFDSARNSFVSAMNARPLLLWLCLLLCSLSTFAWEREAIWPKGKMPDAQPHQIAAMTDEAGAKDFKPDKHRVAYLEWFDPPATVPSTPAAAPLSSATVPLSSATVPSASAEGSSKSPRALGCMILISGGSYQNCCDVGLIQLWRETFTPLGFQCVNFVYRSPGR